MLSWSRKTCAKPLHVLISSALRIAFTIDMPSILITLHFGEVSIIPVKQLIVKSGACVVSDASTSWSFSLLEAILVGVSMAGVRMTSCSLLTNTSRWWSICS